MARKLHDGTTEGPRTHWKQFYQRYMRLINDYKNMGGSVTVGTDSGFIWKTYGFAYIEELKLFREAGFLLLRKRSAPPPSTAPASSTSRAVKPRRWAWCAPACWPTSSSSARTRSAT